MRSARELERYVGVPVLASVPVYATRRERRNEHMRFLLVALLILGVLATYAMTYWMRSGRHI